MKHRLLASLFTVAFAASALAQQSTKPATQPAQDLPDGPQPTQAALIQPSGPTVVMDTSMGQITCQFFQKQAPVAVANFIGLANGTKEWTDPATGKKMHGKPYYDGTTFHRVIPEFMIQGGDPTGTGTGDPGYAFNDEFDPDLNFDVPGRLAMANSGPNTNGSQFFITEQAYASLDQHYTIFGQCDDPSVNVVKTIARVQRDANDKPLVPVYLKKVMIVPENAPPPPQPGSGGSVAVEIPKRVLISAGVAAGMIQSKTPPSYPDEAKVKGISGTVVLDTIIGTDGTVQDLKVVSGRKELQQAALDAVKSWRYRPYLLNNTPVEVRTTVNVIFSLSR
ncbi:MAG TPA: TonB family protein [Terracidiphilus sp.]|jgi:peptidyl-prolyl cis-trans isomerase A (cyclophilin A)|nr:TonB family protein [Terracidiphilus sp.]